MFSKSLKAIIKNPIVVIPNVIIALLALVFYPLTNVQARGSGFFTFPSQLGSAALVLVLSLVYELLIYPFFICWSYLMCRDAANEEKPSLVESFKLSWRRYPLALGTYLLIVLMIVGAFFVIGLLSIPFIILLKFPDGSGISSGAVIAGIIVSIVVICIVLLFAVIISPIIIIQIYDDLDLGESFSYGFKLGFKKFFPILGVMLLSIVVILPLLIIFGLLSGSFERIHPVYNFIYSSLGAFPGMFLVIYIMNLYKSMDMLKQKPILNPEAEAGPKTQEPLRIEENTPTQNYEDKETPDSDHIV